VSADVLTAAHAARRRGWRTIAVHGVRPDRSCTCGRPNCGSNAGKHPVDAGWQNTPEMSAADVQATFEDQPWNLGVATGEPSGCWVLDIDPGSGGFESARKLQDKHGPLPPTVAVQTGGGGYHFYFAMPADFEVRNRQGIVAGIDVRGTGGMAVMPPSTSAKGPYRWTVSPGDVPELPQAPDWLLEMLRPTVVEKGAVFADDVPDRSAMAERERNRLDRYAAGIIGKEVARLDECRKAATSNGQGYRGPAWQTTTFEVSCTLIQLANSPWSQLTEQGAYELVRDHAPRDRGFTDAGINKAFRSARGRVGGKARALPGDRTAPPVAAATPGATVDPFEDASGGAWAATTPSPAAPSEVAGEPGGEAAPLPAGAPLTDAYPAATAVAVLPATEAETEAVGPDVGERHRGQARMAYRLAAAYAGRLLHVHGLGWLAWDGSRWAEDHRGVATRAVLAVARRALTESFDDRRHDDAWRKALRDDVRKCESASGVQGVLAIAGDLSPLSATVDELDVDPYLLNVANGTLDLRTGALRPHDPADRITKVTRAAYRPGEELDGGWSAFLTQVLPDPEVRGFLQRVIGVGLLGLIVEHVLPIWTGTGANGKGVAYGAITWALGDYAMVAEPDLLMHREGAHPTGEMDLRGRRLVVVSESDRGRKLAEATMKRLTGGDRIKARRMRQDFVEFSPSHTAILVTNHLPLVSGDDPAVWRRLRVIPFGVVIPEHLRDSHLPERLQLDADAVLTWAVAGYTDYVRRGLAEPQSVLVATGEYQRDSDPVTRFLDEETVRNSQVSCTTRQLHARWSEWAQRDGAAPMSERALGKALDTRGFPTSPPVNGQRLRHGIGLLATGGEVLR
jgi:putative DNA primase/helicase